MTVTSGSAEAPVIAGFREPGSPDRRRPSTAGAAVGLTWLACGIGLAVAALVDLAGGATGAARGEVVLPLAGCALGSGLAGALLRRRYELPNQLRAGPLLATVAVVWVSAVAVSAGAYLATGTFDRLDDAVFESVSGFTTTGMTVLRPVEGTASGILLWRALTQWLGGFAAVTVAVVVLPFFGGGGLELVETDRGARRSARLTPRVIHGARRLSRVYVGLTAAVVVLYLAGGMGPFDAVTYALTTASTGGFANHTDSLGFFDSAVIEWVTIVAMVLAGANFALYWHGLRGGRGSFLRSVELRAYLIVMAAGALVVAASTLATDTAAVGASPAEAVRHAVFSVVAVVTTTGYSVVDWGTWVVGAQVLLLVLIGVGAMSGSTGGGFRLLRVLGMLAYVRRELVRQLHPRSVTVVKIGDQPLGESLLARMICYAVLYVLVGAAAAVGVAAGGAELVTAMSVSISALSTVGPALGELSPAGDALALDAPARGVLMATMLAGRLEIYPVVALVAAALVATRRRARTVLDRVRRLVRERP
ncbi:hypothetical protein BH20ACT2_BH20ACT2_07580 [soil metagenome]